LCARQKPLPSHQASVRSPRPACGVGVTTNSLTRETRLRAVYVANLGMSVSRSRPPRAHRWTSPPTMQSGLRGPGPVGDLERSCSTTVGWGQIAGGRRPEGVCVSVSRTASGRRSATDASERGCVGHKEGVGQAARVAGEVKAKAQKSGRRAVADSGEVHSGAGRRH
jgi:hypothetical protein